MRDGMETEMEGTDAPGKEPFIWSSHSIPPSTFGGRECCFHMKWMYGLGYCRKGLESMWCWQHIAAV